jgi:hypothetical protein
MVPSGIGFHKIEVGGPKVEEIRARKLSIQNKLFQVRDSGCVDEQMRGQDGYILIIEGAVVIIRAVREVVSFVGHARLVDKLKVELSHLGQIVGDAAANFLQVSVVFEVRVICQDTNFMWGPHQEVTPSE